MLGHLMEKPCLRTDQEIQVYFIINPDLIGNGQGLHYGKRNTVYFLCLFPGELKTGFFCFRFFVSGLGFLSIG